MTWTAPEVTLTPQVLAGDERAVLDSLLNRGREILLWKCQGLNGVQLSTRSVEPSTMSLLGLIRHMAEVERGWFRKRAAGEQLDNLYCTDTNEDGDFHDTVPEDAEADYARLLDEIAQCDKAIAPLPLDHTVSHPRSGKDLTLRWIYLHMIEEYARHAGHADLLRERIDGATGYQ
ncbi:DinB family protein [Nocardia yunnanensis]|uniref:DinB family protein n=1 Tax=Nocardia yunnanensis TaxID=2382165 RepID=A0A386Z8V4_9NOCA|nr:DinB family protein [Nocardia yunnanensis]AYF74070.1 DinB family protein [Nocardia yunnanensis]